MRTPESIINQLFQPHETQDFNALCLDLFRFQYKNNTSYRQFVDFLGKHPKRIQSYRDIPFLPISFFKTQQITAGWFVPEVVFTSSGTTGSATSQHFVKSKDLYIQSFMAGFNTFFGSPEDFVILALLPSYLEREGSSLVLMADELIRKSNHPESGFFLHDYQGLSVILDELKAAGKPTLLLGVTYALLDMAEQFPIDFPELKVMETGGMKGKRKEMVRDELHQQLKAGFGVGQIYSEYGMTELLSQAYSTGEGIFRTPSWMKVLIRDTNDPLTLLPENQSGGINVIDLANVYSCAFIETQDLGKSYADGSFEVLGRFDNSDVRGCNLMVV
ncbi:MAG: acyltransferase [Bacteroidales bacterium]|jgi:phenylacetate-coenzyme A ligase PaaK-like adenylate-forming protein